MFDRWSILKAVRPGAALVMVALLAVGAMVLTGCDDVRQKEKAFKDEWTRVIKGFEARTAKDDKKGQELVAENDLAGVIDLTRKRIAYSDEVLGELLELYPPQELRKLHVLSLYYLITIKDRLDQQISLYEAILNNRPTADIETVLEQLIARNQTIGRELGIELQKEGISLDQKPEDGTGRKTSTSP